MRKNKLPPLLRIVKWVYPRLERTIPSLAHRFFVTIFFTPLNYKVPEKEKALQKEAERFSVMAGGKKVQCYAWGEGPVVLLVHGWVGRTTGKPFDEFTSLHFITNIRQYIRLLLIHDEDDQEVSINHALELMKLYPGATLFKTSGLGHTRILKDEKVINKCLAFIR